MDKLIDSKTKEARKQKIEEYKKYILNHWRGIQNMKDSLCKSSMEAHIEHCVASTLLSYYLQTFNNNDDFVYNNKKKN